MRSIKVAFIALALSAATTAFAAATTSDVTVTLNNEIVDTINVSGGVTVTFTELGTKTDDSTTLAYSTHSDENGATPELTSRKVTVSSTALPEGVTGTVAFTPGNSNGTGSTKALSTTSVSLVTGIPAFITQNAAALTYSFTATKGFVAAPITITYTLADE